MRCDRLRRFVIQVRRLPARTGSIRRRDVTIGVMSASGQPQRPQSRLRWSASPSRSAIRRSGLVLTRASSTAIHRFRAEITAFIRPMRRAAVHVYACHTSSAQPHGSRTWAGPDGVGFHPASTQWTAARRAPACRCPCVPESAVAQPTLWTRRRSPAGRRRPDGGAAAGRQLVSSARSSASARCQSSAGFPGSPPRWRKISYARAATESVPGAGAGSRCVRADAG